MDTWELPDKKSPLRIVAAADAQILWPLAFEAFLRIKSMNPRMRSVALVPSEPLAELYQERISENPLIVPRDEGSWGRSDVLAPFIATNTELVFYGDIDCMHFMSAYYDTVRTGIFTLGLLEQKTPAMVVNTIARWSVDAPWRTEMIGAILHVDSAQRGTIITRRATRWDYDDIKIKIEGLHHAG